MYCNISHTIFNILVILIYLHLYFLLYFKELNYNDINTKAIAVAVGKQGKEQQDEE